MEASMSAGNDFRKLIEMRRPPNMRQDFPPSQALLVRGKVIGRAMIAKIKVMIIAANKRSFLVIGEALKAAKRATAASYIIIR